MNTALIDFNCNEIDLIEKLHIENSGKFLIFHF